jgi:type II secretory pathway pseudopilin PulG
MLRKRLYNRGDTLVEVLFAVAIFSFVAVGSLSIMNQGTAATQRALEITLVRQEIDAQAEALRFLNASYISNSTHSNQWILIKRDYAKENVSDFDIIGAGATCPSVRPANSFIVNTRIAQLVGGIGWYEPAPTFSQVIYKEDSNVSAYGIWIEAVGVDGAEGEAANYIDFHIRACWDSPGQSVPVTLGTIVRLYEPK